MKKRLRKTVAIALIACMCLAVVPMFASAAYDITVSASVSGSTATISGTAEASQQVAIVVVPCTHSDALVDGACPTCDLNTLAESAVYVNQVTAGSDATYSFEVTNLDAGKYTAFVGGSDANAQVKVTFTVGSSQEVDQIKYGDLDESGAIDNTDVIRLAQIVSNLRTAANNVILASDIDGSQLIDNTDVIRLAQVVTNLRSETKLGSGSQYEYVPAGSIVKDAEGNTIAQLA